MYYNSFFTLTLSSLFILTTPITLNVSNNKPLYQNIKKMMPAAFMVSLTPLLLFINQGLEMYTTNLNLFSINNFNINLSFIMDMYSMTFIPIALFVTWSILEFSTWYMKTDPNINKFFKYLLIFLLAMMTLVTANNMFQFFIGWEGVGILSFLLIGWWFARADANSSALQAIIYNRIGDIGLILMIAWSSMNLSSWQMNEIFSMNTNNTLPALGLILAATGKSAQFGLHPWLPAAMEGPTPVSALLHSSTMVVAGIFLLIRLHPMLESNHNLLTMCLCLGALTTVFTAICALTQNDIKKIIAFSTSSQLGLMMVTIGLSQPQLAFIHISTHAFFKAMLFLCSGAIIHSLSDEQDIRMMGNIKHTMPLSSACLTIGALALMGTPFLSGFYSKDTIIETLNNSNLNAWALMLTIIATMLTAAYCLRIIYYVQMGPPRHSPLSTINENFTTLTNPISRLALGSLIAGLLITTTMLPNKTLPMTMPTMAKLLALMITATGLILSMDITNKTSMLSFKEHNLNYFTSNQFMFFNALHRTAPAMSMEMSQKLSTITNDLLWLEKVGPKGLTDSQKPLINISSSQKGLIKAYLTTLVISTLLLISTL
uniref:NADH-ubiquinone oxidoreductase chain 5 n=1 Tax=Anolis punctatus TaxID=174263 RepID=A0A513X1C5_ANOPN|nr:NADH dehydrogenase subunit 5 [Anolis punctatus]QDH07723.1 NADH dehydrogenase subunit 5 [Anolis punctatus]